MTARIGFIGLGAMGAPIASRLVATGHDVVVFDLSAEAVAKLVGEGAEAGESAADVARKCGHVGICVPTDVHVVDVVTGDNGILVGAVEETTVAIHSTVHPDTVRDLCALADESEVILFDAGVAGGKQAAEAGTLAITVGVPAGGIPDRAQEALDACGTVIEAGTVGTGMALKVGLNVMTYLQQAAASASYQVAMQEGVDCHKLIEAWRHLGMLGSLTEQFFPLLTMDPASKVEGGFGEMLQHMIALAEKDLDVASHIGLESGRPMPVVEATRDAMQLIYGITPPVSPA